MNERLMKKRIRQRLLSSPTGQSELESESSDSIGGSRIIGAKKIKLAAETNQAMAMHKLQIMHLKSDEETDKTGLLQRLTEAHDEDYRAIETGTSTNVNTRRPSTTRRKHVSIHDRFKSNKHQTDLQIHRMARLLLAGPLLALLLVSGSLQQVASISDPQQLLLKSANVELNRSKLQRLQRDTITGAELVPAQPATCGYPGSPAHASVTFNTSHVVAGTAATYTCDNGYELLGPPKRICQANGTWSPIGIPFCGK